MNNKYNKAISKVNTNDELKSKIILEMNKVNKKQGGVIMKIKKTITTILAILSALVCSGAVYAGVAILTGKNINDLFAWAGVKFSDNYEEYVEVVENQYIEDNGFRIELESKVCDEGFIVLSFRVLIDEEQAIDIDGDFKGEPKLSFNEEILKDEDGYEYLNTNGSNHNVIIDGEEVFVRSSSLQEVETIVEGKEYKVYQLWFLPSDKIENKEKFVITLDNIVALFGDRGHEKINGKFEIEVSKEKALNNTTYIEAEDAIITFKGMKQTLEKCVETPLQNLIKISTNHFAEDIDDLTHVVDENYVGEIRYKVYDQDGNELVVTNIMPTYEARIYEDGTKEESNPGEGYFKDENIKNVQSITEKYIVIERSENIKKITIEVYENNEYYGIERKIGNYYIDLENKDIKAESCNKISSVIIQELLKNETTDEYFIEKSKVLEEDEFTFIGEEPNYSMKLSLKENGNLYMNFYNGAACLEGEEYFIELVARNVESINCEIREIEEDWESVVAIKLEGENLEIVNSIYDFIEY